MPQPTAYTRQYDFTGFSSNYPSDQQPGTQLDAEFNAVKTTLDGALTNLAKIQRDDGALSNSSVTLTQLASDVLTYFGDLTAWTIRGAWATATAYAVGNLITQSGNTYVCVVAHTSGTFAVDLAAVKWITIYGSTTTVVPDNAVTTAKIADGAVTPAKLSLTALDLTGTIRAQGGLAAGTETAGTYVIGGKLATGDSYSSIGRTTRAQGNVGLRIGGGTSGADWYLRQATSSDDLSFYNTLGNVSSATLYSSGLIDILLGQRVTGWTPPATGAGLESGYAAGVSFIQSYNRGSTTWLPLSLRGSTVTLSPTGVDMLQVTSSTAQVKDAYANFQDIGYRGIPQITKTASYTLALTDAGQHISITTGGVVIPANGTVAFPIGATIVVYNDSASTQTISITTDTLRLAGTTNTGSVSLAAYGLASLVKVKSTVWVAAGNVS